MPYGDNSPPAVSWTVRAGAEIIALLGAPAPTASLVEACAFIFAGPGSLPSELHVLADAAQAWSRARHTHLTLMVSKATLAELGGDLLLVEAGGFHLSSTLKGLAKAMLEPQVPAQAQAAYRLAKAIEAVCEALTQHRDGELLPLASDGALSAGDTRRVLAARRLIDERCNEKLTVDAIARSCGMNRSKLSRGFRYLFNCSVAEALSERRLERASRMLLTTDLPIGCVGYEAGYENNASFARAFGRRFGRTPSDYRTGILAA